MVKANIITGNRIVQVTRKLEHVRKIKNRKGMILPISTKILITWDVNVKVKYYRIDTWK